MKFKKFSIIAIFLNVVVESLSSSQTAPPVDPADRGLNSSQLLDKYNYPFEIHSVTTSDGYKLKIFRILSTNPTGPGAGKVVLLNHGLKSSSTTWLILGPGYSLAYLLADEGYDVWLQNNRGNGVSMEGGPSQGNYWDFDLDDMGRNDTPPAIDLALATTKQNDLIFIGHSQGCTMYAIMCHLLPEYEAKVSRFIGLSPLLNMKYVSPLVSLGRVIVPISLFNVINFNVASSKNSTNPCWLFPGGYLCRLQYFLTNGWSPNEINTPLLKLITSVFPEGASFKNYEHIAQWFKKDYIRMYNYGWNNKKHYNSSSPPIYNISELAPHTQKYFFYGSKDSVVNSKAVEYIVPKLQCVSQTFKLPYAHNDPILGITAREKVNKPILSILSQPVTPC